MYSVNNKIDFSNLLSSVKAKNLLHHLSELANNNEAAFTDSMKIEKSERLTKWKSEWQNLSNIKANSHTQPSFDYIERISTNWLIQLFNVLFAEQKVVLARSAREPEYFPARDNQPARIEFANGFFASALHELSHWCVAGKRRRTLSDFGYWYAPDGRSAAQQLAFEHVEIKPQALECLFTLACGGYFQVSQDNLFAEFDTSGSTFANDVYLQVEAYIAKPDTLPNDAKTLLLTLLSVCSSDSGVFSF